MSFLLVIFVMLSVATAKDSHTTSYNIDSRLDFHIREAIAYSAVFEKMAADWDENIRKKQMQRNISRRDPDKVFLRARQHAELAYFFSGIQKNNRR